MALTSEGMVKGKAFRRLPEGDRFDATILDELRGVPWDLRGKLKEGTAVVGEDFAAGLPIKPQAKTLGMEPLKAKTPEAKAVYHEGRPREV